MELLNFLKKPFPKPKADTMNNYISNAVPQWNEVNQQYELVKDGVVIAYNNLTDAYIQIHMRGK